MLFQAPTLVSLYLFLPFSHLSSFLFLSLLSLPNPSPLHRPHSSVPCSGNGPAPNCHPRPAPTVRSDQTTTHRPLLPSPPPPPLPGKSRFLAFPKNTHPNPKLSLSEKSLMNIVFQISFHRTNAFLVKMQIRGGSIDQKWFGCVCFFAHARVEFKAEENRPARQLAPDPSYTAFGRLQFFSLSTNHLPQQAKKMFGKRGD